MIMVIYAFHMHEGLMFLIYGINQKLGDAKITTTKKGFT